MRDKDLIEKSVISIADGERVGVVKDLVFLDLNVLGLLVMGNHGQGLLPFSKLESIGPDAIMVASTSVVDWNAGSVLVSGGRNTRDLRKLSVVDSEGNFLGHIHDFNMDSTGQIKEINIRTEGVFGIGSQRTMVEGAEVCGIGSDVITVRAAQAA
jgi:sporulation protein YlmC with PRC-barrel domain